MRQRPGGRRGRGGCAATDGGQGRHARAEAGRTGLRIHRHDPVAALVHGAAGSRRVDHADLRQVRRPRPRRRAARADQRRQAAGHGQEHRGQPGGHRGRRAVLAAAGQAARVARRRGRHQPAGVRPGPELPAHGRSAARRARSAGQRGPRRAGVLPRRRAAVGSDWRHPRAHRRSGHHVHGDHDHRRERRARGLHSDSPRSLAGSAHGPAGAAARRPRASRSPPTPSPSSRRASTTRRRRSW